MSRDRAMQIAQAAADLASIPSAAEQELIVELSLIGRDVLAVQQRLAPVGATGRLSGALSMVVDRLRVRIGLLNPKLAPFYGRIVEFGRHAQTVLVQRRRRVGGRLRLSRRRKRTEDIAATYSLHVKARAARPFIDPTNPDLDTIAANRVADFWANVMARAGQGA